MRNPKLAHILVSFIGDYMDLAQHPGEEISDLL